jgi:hypothetical protein
VKMESLNRANYDAVRQNIEDFSNGGAAKAWAAKGMDPANLSYRQFTQPSATPGGLMSWTAKAEEQHIKSAEFPLGLFYPAAHATDMTKEK